MRSGRGKNLGGTRESALFFARSLYYFPIPTIREPGTEDVVSLERCLLARGKRLRLTSCSPFQDVFVFFFPLHLE